MTQTASALFARVRAAQERQGWKRGRSRVSNLCVYRIGGVGCSIGALMPPEISTGKFEGHGIFTVDRLSNLYSDEEFVIQMSILEAAGIDESLRDLAHAIQETHDLSFNDQDWQESFTNLEAHYAVS